MSVIGMVSDFAPVASITSCACSKDSGEEVLYGMRRASTFSPPRASAARKQATEESTPPETPTTARSNPWRPSSVRMKSVRMARARSVLISSERSEVFIDRLLGTVGQRPRMRASWRWTIVVRSSRSSGRRARVRCSWARSISARVRCSLW